MAYKERDPKQDASQILSASSSLRKSLSQLSAGPAGRTNVTFKLTERPEVGEAKGGGEATPLVGAHQMVVVMEGEISHVEALGQQLTDQGCTCTSIPSSDPDDPNLGAQECDCSDLPE